MSDDLAPRSRADVLLREVYKEQIALLDRQEAVAKELGDHMNEIRQLPLEFQRAASAVGTSLERTLQPSVADLRTVARELHDSANRLRQTSDMLAWRTLVTAAATGVLAGGLGGLTVAKILL